MCWYSVSDMLNHALFLVDVHNSSVHESIDFRQIFQFELRDYYGGFNIHLENEVPEMITKPYLITYNHWSLLSCM